MGRSFRLPAGALATDSAPHLPLCSFGPGGSYVVDWTVRAVDCRRPAGPPRTLGVLFRRLAAKLLFDTHGWMVASHPGRLYRIDRVPAALEPCRLCGLSTPWPAWFVAGEAGPRVLDDRGEAVAAVENLPVGDLATAAHDPVGTVPAGIDAAAPETYLFPRQFTGNAELEPVLAFHRSPAGRLVARLSEASRESNALSGFPRPTADRDDSAAHHAPGNEPPISHAPLALEALPHDPDPQTTQNPHGDPRLSGPQRLLPHDAGTRRPARRLKSHDLRTRRSPGAERTRPPCPEQGSLFGGLPGGEAA